jgi:hypothetical protein
MAISARAAAQAIDRTREVRLAAARDRPDMRTRNGSSTIFGFG